MHQRDSRVGSSRLYRLLVSVQSKAYATRAFTLTEIAIVFTILAVVAMGLITVTKLKRSA